MLMDNRKAAIPNATTLRAELMAVLALPESVIELLVKLLDPRVHLLGIFREPGREVTLLLGIAEREAGVEIIREPFYFLAPDVLPLRPPLR